MQTRRQNDSKNERQFYDALKEVFIGAAVEGDSGYINLMRIKARYYEQVVFPQLQRDIAQALEPFPDFREELFLKLYTFFKRYFSESGAIYFRYTPLHQSVYEQVYTDDRDVILFWKTHMLYYVKTDRLFQSLEVELDGVKFFFDVSTLQHKRANEKRELVYEFAARRDDGTLVFTVTYAERGRKTKLVDIRRALRQSGAEVGEDTLEGAFRVFERQSEVDYFINKNARAFLQEQFNFWAYQYFFSGESGWTERRVKQLQALKGIAFKIIDFISQFEDELVKIWNKPKFVLNSNYVITLDKLAAAGAGGVEMLRRVLAHPNFAAQAAEWQELGLVDAGFTAEAVWEHDLLGTRLAARYRFLPLDTRHFKDVEPEILGLFDDLDAALDGWLIRSENYQALNTILPKWRGRVKCVHIDPPYNTETSGFLYANTYQHSSWLSMMRDRLEKAASLLSRQGCLFCHIDENEVENLIHVIKMLSFEYQGTIIWDKRNPVSGTNRIAVQHEYILSASAPGVKLLSKKLGGQIILEKAKKIIEEYEGVTRTARRKFKQWVLAQRNFTGGERAYCELDADGRVHQLVHMGAPEKREDPKFYTPLLHPVTGKPCPVPANGWSATPDFLQACIARNEIAFGLDENTQPRRKYYLENYLTSELSSVIHSGDRGKKDADALNLDFPYSHPVSLYEMLVWSNTHTGEGIVLDFFAGSGTTAHAVINLNRADGGRRKYILVEMADYFETVLLPRLKKVIFCEKWREGKPAGGAGISHFVKYYELEQYEDALRRARYEDADLFSDPYADPYSQYIFRRDLKMLEALEVDLENNTVRVDLAKLYPNIDLAETLANLRGQGIKRVAPDYVEFADGTRLDFATLDYRVIKPLIWW